MALIQVIEDRPATKVGVGFFGWLFILLVAAGASIAVIAILMVNMRSASDSQKQVADTINLKRLSEVFLSGQADARSRRIPRSTGYRFWLALVVGDGPGPGNLEITGHDDPDIYLSTFDAPDLLISPADGHAVARDEVKRELDATVESGSGVNGLGFADLMCSYAGPVDPRRDMRAKDSPIIGCTRERDGVSIFADGFSAVTNSVEARFYTFREMIDVYRWPAGTDVPLYGEMPLERVSGE